jgi:hypothetical protein
LGLLLFVASRERKAAAQIIYAELLANLGAVRTLIKIGSWPETSEKPKTAAWDAFGIRLLRGAGVNQVGSIALAYSSLDGLVWLSGVHREEFQKADHSEALRDIHVGLYEVGRECGLMDAELRARGVLTEDVNAEWADRQARSREGRPGRVRRAWSRFRR